MKYIYGLDKHGNKYRYEVILTYYSPEYKKDYVVYTQNNYNGNEELEIYINYYDKHNLTLSKDIEDKEEYKNIKTIVNSILLTMKNEQNKI